MPSGVSNMMQSGTVSNMPRSAVKGLWIAECSRAVSLRPWKPEKVAAAGIFSSFSQQCPQAFIERLLDARVYAQSQGCTEQDRSFSTFSKKDSLVAVTGGSEQKLDKSFFLLFKAQFLVMRVSYLNWQAQWQGFCKVPFAFSVLDTFGLNDVPSSRALSRNCLKNRWRHFFLKRKDNAFFVVCFQLFTCCQNHYGD